MSELHSRVLAGLVEGRIVSDIGVNKLAVLSSGDLPSVVEASSLLLPLQLERGREDLP